MSCVYAAARQPSQYRLGGSLVQHLDVRRSTPARPIDPAYFDRCHTVRVSPGSMAEKIYGGDVPTNSLHHQAVGRAR